MAIEFSDKKFVILENKYIDGGLADNVHVIVLPTNTTDNLTDIEEKRPGMIAFDSQANQVVAVDNTGTFQPVSAGGTVASFNGRTGAVVPQAGDYDAAEVTYDNTVSGLAATDVQDAIDEIAASVPTGTPNTFTGFDGSGDLSSFTAFTLNNITGGLAIDLDVEPNNLSQSLNINSSYTEIRPLQNSPDEAYVSINNQFQIDPDSTGFDIGTTGTAARFLINNLFHNGTSDLGSFEFIQNNFSLGNGTDPIDVNGFSYAFGFGQVNANVNISGPMQGYGFQFNVNSAATIDPSTYISGFYDATNIATATPNYQSGNFSPTIASINNNNNYLGLTITPTIPIFTGNAGFIGVNVGGNLGTFNTNGYFNGVNVNPIITSARYAAGLQVTMDNVTPYAGVQSSLVEQDLTFTFIQPGDNNNYTLEYTPGATAGSEVVSILGTDITVQIEDGVSTATQIKAAMDAIPNLAAAITVTISGVGGNAQDIFGPENFTGGVNPGNVLAAYLDGDVEITGDLTFGGALSIGKLNAFAAQAIIDGGGSPQSIHSLVSSPTVAANTTVANGDTLGINTAMLLTMGDNAVVTTSFVGLAALALPAVVQMGTGATIDQVSGGTFAISLDPGATGGTIANLDLCRSIAIPNGTTSITRLSGYKFDLPFGDPGTTTWGFYASPTVHNYLAGDLLVGGTAGSDDVVSNSSVAVEVKSTTKAVVLSRMTTVQKNALTSIAGMIVFDTTLNQLSYYDGSSWIDL